MKQQKLKIGFFTDTYKPQVNGVVSSIENFRQELENQGHEVYIFCPQVGKEKSTDKIARFRSFKFVFQPEYHISIPFTRHILGSLWAKDLDIVHAQTPFSLGILGYYYAYIKKVPFVYTFHTLYPEYIKSYIFKGKLITPKMVERLTAVFSNRCDLNIAPSEKISRLLKGYGVTTPVKVLPTGLKLEDFKHLVRNKFRQKYGLETKDRVLVYVGRLGKEKNIDFLLKAMLYLKEADEKIKLVIIGDGPDKSKLEAMVKGFDLYRQVIFTGYLKKPQVIEAYQASDLFVFASKTDTQGMVILEAAACGLPIVAVKDLAFSNMLRSGYNGFFVKEDKKEFAAAVVKILRNKNLENRLASNSIKIAQQFSIGKSTEQLVNYYLQIKNK